MYVTPPLPKIFERWGFGGRKLFIKSFLPPTSPLPVTARITQLETFVDYRKVGDDVAGEGEGDSRPVAVGGGTGTVAVNGVVFAYCDPVDAFAFGGFCPA
jgi:hypothetical protein